MKTKTFLLACLVSFFASMSASAQTIVKGDMDDDGQVTIADVTSLVNVAVGRTPMTTIDVGSSPFAVDNTLVVGTWYASDGTHFTLGADGTTDYGTGFTYKFRPSQGTLMMFNASGKPVKTFVLNEVESAYLLAIDYATGTYTYYTNSASLVTNLALNETSLAMNPGTTAQLSVTVTPAEAFNSDVTWSSSDENVATVSETGLVTAVAGGTCTITCTAKDGSGVTATCLVTVVGGGSDSHAYVDLGLPSGTLWATTNIGAENPEDYGLYFAWGETTGYTQDTSDGHSFNWTSYKYAIDSYRTLTKYCNSSSYGYNGFTDTLTELEPEDDAAYVNWGANWRMPSLDQIEELINSSYTTTTWTTQNGVYGRKITSKSNGNSLFLPAAGYRSDSSLSYAGSGGHYWSRTLCTSGPNYACYLYFYSDHVDRGIDDRYLGSSVRPVRSPQ